MTRGQTYAISCPSGQLATGGGYAQPNSSMALAVGTSAPNAVGNSPPGRARWGTRRHHPPIGWYVVVDNRDAQPYHPMVYVICAPGASHGAGMAGRPTIER